MNTPMHHRRHLSGYQRMAQFEELITKLTVPIAIAALGAALAFGLLNSTGHVTW